ncbi:hypothetical protein DFA_09928 [Cavenderia fasciculata]|uniref:Transmembrane protein n=1 Tax=Cavenderia fasciculata TaxID=261658 RepID=F4Q8T5_CACFS|nr:uncharacterized protein DFA_09928 [Cavenderia fasciculata]EGG15104.1 hypothetical protein DFA_09928 [Cavenderia fasciculata]|eukprot:XP_004351824.1 hypothetical protein DFA_09928 [Cavenderia fasciculata]
MAKHTVIEKSLGGFEKEYPSILEGLIDPLDYKLILHGFNSHITFFRFRMINFFITFIISLIPLVIFLVVNNHMQALITGSLGSLNIIFFVIYLITANRRINKVFNKRVLRLSDRYAKAGISFSLEPKREHCGCFSTLILNIYAYDLEIQVNKASDNNNNSYYNDKSVGHGAILIN